MLLASVRYLIGSLHRKTISIEKNMHQSRIAMMETVLMIVPSIAFVAASSACSSSGYLRMAKYLLARPVDRTIYVTRYVQ